MNEVVTNGLSVFENEQFGSVRVVGIEKDGQTEPWFVATDVCMALEISNPTVALARLDNDERSKFNLGRQGFTNIVNEPGLYSLVLGSRKPEAKAFKRWITHEVIPSIRKHGGYIAGQEDLSERELLAMALVVANNVLVEREKRLAKLRTENKEQKAQIEEMKPKVNYTDCVLNSPELTTIRVIAQDYGMTAVAFNKLLHELGVQYKQGKTWILYANYAGKGYVQSKTHLSRGNDGKDHNHSWTYWTQKGRFFLHELLHEHGIYPVTETA